ncbi:MAG: hypothetical protein R6V32_06660 [Bacteroidales bacterium]
MVVIGNNIINLRNESNFHVSYNNAPDKYFTAGELIFADLCHDFSGLACMWAMKICAYKCMLKLGLHQSFVPKEYHVTLEKDNGYVEGKVFFRHFIFYTKCIDDENFIRCVATNHPEKLNLIKSFHLRFKNKKTDKYDIIAQKIRHFTNTSPLLLHKLKKNIPVLTNLDFSQMLELSLTKTGQLYYVSVLPEWYQVNADVKKNKDSAVYA